MVSYTKWCRNPNPGSEMHGANMLNGLVGEVRCVSFGSALVKVTLPSISTCLNGPTKSFFNHRRVHGRWGIQRKCMSQRMYTVRVRLQSCRMHVSPHWSESIGNRKRCSVLRSGSFWYSRHVGVLAAHVMTSHERTYIWRPAAAGSEQIRA